MSSASSRSSAGEEKGTVVGGGRGGGRGRRSGADAGVAATLAGDDIEEGAGEEELEGMLGDRGKRAIECQRRLIHGGEERGHGVGGNIVHGDDESTGG